MATNLETLDLSDCSSLVEVRHSSIQKLNKMKSLNIIRCIKLVILPTGINLESLRCFDLSGCSRLRTFPDISRNISKLSLNRTAIQEIPSNLRLENLIDLRMEEIKSEKLWEGVQTLRPLMTMLSPSLEMSSLSLKTKVKTLILSEIPSLVELPSYLGNLSKLTHLQITNCTNLETIPSGINLKYLNCLDLSGCLRFRIFPDISNNISDLHLNQTGIEEVPWWIENFTSLEFLFMKECNKLKHVSLNVSKLKHLEDADFTGCRGLTEASWHDHRPMEADIVSNVEFDFMNCFKLDQEALLQKQPVFKLMILPGEEVPSYFNHRTMNGSSFAVKTALSQPFFRFRASVVVDAVSISTLYFTHVAIQVNCLFRGDILGNQFDSSSDDGHSFVVYHKANHVVVFDCCFALNNKCNASLLAGDVDIAFHLTSDDSLCKIKGCGIRVFEDCSSANILEADELILEAMRLKSVETVM